MTELPAELHASVPLLSIITFLPFIAALVLVLFLRGDARSVDRNAKWVALITSLVVFVISIFIYTGFDPSHTGFQLVEERDWLLGLKYKMGVDGVSLLFVMLTTIIMPIVFLSTWEVRERPREYMVAFLVLEGLMIGVFSSLDLALFYIFFEGGLIPMYVIIGTWGHDNRIYAALKFFLYTFLGSVLMLVAMVTMYNISGTTDIPTLMHYNFASTPITFLGITIGGGVQMLLWIAFFASFAVKLPMWPVHTWLPDAHVEAPTAGSVVLAAILLKMGGYGFIRFSLPMFPEASLIVQPFMMWLGAIAIVYTSLVALAQLNWKKLTAYSSVAHMGYVSMGVFTLNQIGVDGAIYQMISHGFISAALFLIVGVMYDRAHSLEIADFGGLANRMPAYALVFMFFTMANLGLPGTSGFVGEFLTLMSTFHVNTWVTAVATSGVILSASYALWLYRRVVFGALVKEGLQAVKDISLREKLLFAPLVALVLILGVYPRIITDITGPTVAALLDDISTRQVVSPESGPEVASNEFATASVGQ